MTPGNPNISTGLYNPADEHDSCGVAFVADISRRGPSRRIVELAFEALRNLAHRGALGDEDGTGDGAGILVPLPFDFLRRVCDFELPAAGHFAAGVVFLPSVPADRSVAVADFERLATEFGLRTVGWRDVPLDPSAAGPGALEVQPHVAQVFVESVSGERHLALERRAFVLRKAAERMISGSTRPGCLPEP